MSASAVAVLMDGLPSCALTCLVTAIGHSTCTIADVSCQCRNQALNAEVETCVLNHCTIPEALQTKNITQTACGAPIRYEAGSYLPVSVTFMSIVSILVLTRLAFKKFVSIGGICPDDWFVFAAWLTCIASTVLNHDLIMPNGLGRDMWTLSTETVSKFLLGFWIMELCYFLEVSLTKLSMIAFYARIFPGQVVRRTLLGTAVFVALFGTVFVLAAIFQCTPVDYFWGQLRGEQGKCVNVGALAWSHAAINIALDVWLLAVPLSQLRQLQMSLGKKLGVAAMFFVGSFVTIVSIVRLTSLIRMENSTNLTWDYFDVLLWSTVEVMVGIICTCMPVLRLMFVRVARHLGTTISQRYAHGSQDSSLESGSNGRSGSTAGILSGQDEKPLPSLPSPRLGNSIEIGPGRSYIHWTDTSQVSRPSMAEQVYLDRNTQSRKLYV
ncbi:hypothetical protein AB5N19_06922 [Seiridium cardinale]|uniref:CFEM domain-containing protein n=1 Tax=Seiridium cardinale TaxID=138064 RepID=A0ABR2XJU7_9PEZI